MKAKSDIDFEMVALHPTFRDFSNPNVEYPPQINGFDTETADGKLFMLSYQFNGYTPKVITSKDGLDNETIFDVITNRNARGNHNMWFNLSYDAGVICKSVLNKRELQILNYTGSVQTDEWEITYIPGKFLQLEDSNKHVYRHYDASQFFFTSLDKAAKEWLGYGKTEGVDTSKFGLDNGQLNQYILDRFETIAEYAKKDAKLVKELWERFVRKAIELEIPINRPYSTGYLAQQYFEKHGKRKPQFVNVEVQESAWKSYAGGRFEIFERGTFDRVTGFDINSAYPYEMTKLPDPGNCHWHYIEDCTIDDILQYDIGMANITVTTTPGKIQPFPIKDDVRLFPQLNDYTLTVTIDEIRTAERYGMIQDIHVNEAQCGEIHATTTYPFKFLEDIYDERKALEGRGKDLAGLLLKIVMNSLYGKFIQTTPKRYLRDYDGQTYEYGDKERALQSALLPDEIKDELIVEILEAGKLFNPLLASHICARTRTHLVEFIYENDLVDELLMFATDCVMVNGDYTNETFGGWIQDGLGNWVIEYAGEGFIVAPGVYEVEGTKNKRKTRGFNDRFLDGNLRTHIKRHGGRLVVERPRSLGLAVHQSKPLETIGKFIESEKEITPDMDNKRVWNGGDNWDALLTNRFVGEPKTITG